MGISGRKYELVLETAGHPFTMGQGSARKARRPGSSGSRAGLEMQVIRKPDSSPGRGLAAESPTPGLPGVAPKVWDIRSSRVRECGLSLVRVSVRTGPGP